jgi:hypothetical protein
LLESKVMHRFITCPHCEQPFRACYESRSHPVEAAPFLACPHCEEPVPNPGPPAAPPEAFVACRLRAEPGTEHALGAIYRLMVKGWLWIAKVTSPEWPLCLFLLGLLGFLGVCGLKPSERAGVAIVFAMPWLAAAVFGIQKIRNGLGKDARGLFRTMFEVAGLLVALVLLVLTGLTIAGA